MSDKNLPVLFATQAKTGGGQRARLVFIQKPSDDKIALGLEIGDSVQVVIKLSAEQGIGLATAILDANLDGVLQVVERLDAGARQRIAAALLTPEAAAVALFGGGGGPEAA